MDTITIVILYLLGVIISFEYHILQDRYSIEFIIFTSIFYPVIGAVWILLYSLAMVGGAIYGIGYRIRTMKRRKKRNE